MDHKGIDVSQWQGTINWKKVKQSGIQFVIIRDGYGKNEDPRFQEYVNCAKAVGTKILGTYHFIYSLNEAQACQEAEKAVAIAQSAGLPKDTYIFCDFEYDTERYMRQNGVTPSKTLCTKITQAFCERVEQHGYKTGIYLNQDYANRMYTDAIKKKYAFWLWLADYEGEEAFPCLVRQYSSHGVVPGISGNVDMDIWHEKASESSSGDKARVITPKIEYAVKTQNNGILPYVRNGKTAGKLDDKVIGVAIRALDGGKVKYRAHTVAGRWLGEITGCDWDDYYNGYAGNDKDPIDAIQVYYYTDTEKTGGAYYMCRYRVKANGADKYNNWINDTNWEAFDGRSTAGTFGKPIATVQIRLERI